MIRIYDRTGTEQTWQWVDDKYGNVQVYPPPLGVNAYRLIALREREDWAGMEIRVEDEVEMLEGGVRVCQGWRDGPALSDLDKPLGGLPPLLPNCGFVAETDAEGRCSFAWGKGEYYDPERQEGAHYYWIAGAACDVLTGIGMLYNTEHARLEPVYRFVLADDEPEPNPEPADVSELLADMADALEEAQEILADIREALS